MIRLSYTLKCWALAASFFLAFYFITLSSDLSFSKYVYILAVSSLLFPIAKRAVGVMVDAFAPNTVLFDGLLLSLSINIIIWIATPFIVSLIIIAFILYSMGVMTRNISH
ncbi:hypothetical protein M0N77_04880 [Psychrobacter sp. AH5]|uniref:hypothetical protein n=1 Tax=Psychrobacter sp. AH5 TaxID=2937433 RepID=UPI0033414C72